MLLCLIIQYSIAGTGNPTSITLLVSLNNRSLKDKLPGMEGIYMTAPNLLNDKQHLIQDSGEYEIWYDEGGIWKIENKVLGKGVYTNELGLPHEITGWKYSKGNLEVKGLDISIEEDCLPDSDYCKGSLTCGDEGICYYQHLIQKKCCMKA